MNDFFELTLADHIAHLRLNRPERMNTMAPAFFTGLRDAVRGLQDDASARVLVVSSTGKHFSAGMSLDVFANDELAGLDTSSARARLNFQETLRRLMDCFSALDEARFPSLCAIQGDCIGGALDLAAACDIRVCSADAFFTVQEINIGMTADLGVLQRLPKIVPQGVARQMAYTGEQLDAQRALAVGLVNARSSMTPTMIFTPEGQPLVAYGSPGGSSIINSVLNVTLNLIDHKMAIQDAIDAPRVSVTGAGSAISIEAGFPQATLDGLLGLGYTIGVAEIGSVQAVLQDRQTGQQYGAADARREGTVIGLSRSLGR